MILEKRSLLELGTAWNLDSFLNWAHTNARAWSTQPKWLALADFVRCLASESPVVSYISMNNISHIKEWVKDGSRISTRVMQDMMKHSPPVQTAADSEPLTGARPSSPGVETPAA